MAVRILSVGTAVPTTRLSQSQVRDFFVAQPGIDRLAARLIHAAFDQSAIDTRHTVIAELGDASDHEDGLFVDAASRQLHAPSTGTRNALYRREAPALFAAAAADALERAGVAASEITHIVTASCTGFFAPGPGLPAREGSRHPQPRPSATTWDSWDALRPFPRSAPRRGWPTRNPRPSCSWCARSCARCTSAPPPIPSRSWHPRSSPTVPAPQSSRRPRPASTARISRSATSSPRSPARAKATWSGRSATRASR